MRVLTVNWSDASLRHCHRNVTRRCDMGSHGSKCSCSAELANDREWDRDHSRGFVSPIVVLRRVNDAQDVSSHTSTGRTPGGTIDDACMDTEGAMLALANFSRPSLGDR